MNQATGKVIILIGVIIAIAGVVIYFSGGKLNFLGRLPGDIRIEKGNSTFYFPVVTCILLSIIITILVRIIHWFTQH
jgi:hypothetical protein